MKARQMGLSEKQVIESRIKDGSNKISTKKANSILKLFMESLGEPMTKILLIALAVKTLFLLSDFDWYETIGIAIAIFIASLISTVSEYGSEVSFKKCFTKFFTRFFGIQKQSSFFVNDLLVHYDFFL